MTAPDSSRHPFRRPIRLAVALLALYALCTAAAALHQAGALEDAERAGAQGLPAMIRMGHLARCVSFAMPLTDTLTNRCVQASENLISDLEAQGRTDDARVARSALYGALESTFLESGELAEKKRALKAGILPAGAEALPRSSVLAREPWSCCGVMAGALLMVLLTWHVGVRPLLTTRRRKAGLAKVIVGAVLAALFVAGLVLA